jgi:hypothetical protein
MRKADENFEFHPQHEEHVFYANFFALEISDSDQTSMGAIVNKLKLESCILLLSEHEEKERFDSFERVLDRFLSLNPATALSFLMHHSLEMEAHDSTAGLG